MRFSKRIAKIFLIFIATLAIQVAVSAQDPDPNDPPPNAGPDPGNDPVPVDGGLTLLLAAGAAYGVKKYRDGRKIRDGEEPEIN